MGRTRTIIAAALLLLWLPAVVSAQQLVYLVRHAERADGGSSAMTAEADPSLSAAGRARAEKLASLLATAGIRAIYTTEFKRTQETARPLAVALGLTPIAVTAVNTSRLVADLRTNHPGDIVLIVSHSSTLPGIIRALGGPVVTVNEDDYGDLFILGPATGVFSRIRF